jgi:DNA-binding MarR family transcriptional regulator
MTMPETSEVTAFGQVLGMPVHLLRRFQQIAVSMFLKECHHLDLTPLQFATLAALADTPPIDQATLGGMVALDRTTIGVVVRKLEERGLITRVVSPRDRRARMIALSPEGAALLDAALPHVRAVQDRLLAPLAEADRRQLVKLMQTVVDAHNDESRAPLRVAATP